MKRRILLVLFWSIFLVYLCPLNNASGAQYGITVSATAEASNQVTVYIPTGTYHVLTTIDAYLGMSGSATCSSEILSVSTDETSGTYTFESILTINQSGNYIFTATVNAMTGYGYYVNFAITLTDLDVKTLVKTSTIGQAPYAFEIIFIGLIAVAMISIQIRRRKDKN